jgi:hypothetical protein
MRNFYAAVDLQNAVPKKPDAAVQDAALSDVSVPIANGSTLVTPNTPDHELTRPAPPKHISPGADAGANPGAEALKPSAESLFRAGAEFGSSAGIEV